MKTKKQNTIENTKKKSLLKDKRGLSTVEYIIILVLIAVGGIQLWTAFGDTVEDKIESSTNAVGEMQ